LTVSRPPHSGPLEFSQHAAKIHAHTDNHVDDAVGFAGTYLPGEIGPGPFGKKVKGRRLVLVGFVADSLHDMTSKTNR
jgi:hypothetical protein